MFSRVSCYAMWGNPGPVWAGVVYAGKEDRQKVEDHELASRSVGTSLNPFLSSKRNNNNDIFVYLQNKLKAKKGGDPACELQLKLFLPEKRKLKYFKSQNKLLIGNPFSKPYGGYSESRNKLGENVLVGCNRVHGRQNGGSFSNQADASTV